MWSPQRAWVELNQAHASANTKPPVLGPHDHEQQAAMKAAAQLAPLPAVQTRRLRSDLGVSVPVAQVVQTAAAE